MMLTLLVLRNVIVLSDVWSNYDGGDLLEAMTTGNFASDFIDNVWRGWNCYLGRTRLHAGWAILPSVVIIPLYCLFGNSFFVLCQSPVIFSMAIIALIYGLCSRYFDKTVANIAITLYVFQPVQVHLHAVYPYHDLLEVNIYTLAALILLLKAYELHAFNPEKRKARYMAIMSLGFVAAMGVFQSEAYFIMLGSIFVTMILSKPRFLFTKQHYLLFLSTFLLGLIPYFLVMPGISWDWLLDHYGERGVVNISVLPKALMSSHNAVSSTFWLVKYITLNNLAGPFLILVAGAVVMNPQRRFVFGQSASSKDIALNIIRMYVVAYLLVLPASELDYHSFAFPTVGHMSILFAIALRDLFYYLSNRRIPQFRWVVLVILLLCCGFNFMQVIAQMDPTSWKDNLKKQMLRRGNNFFHYLGYYAPAGFKTPNTVAVEQAGKKIVWSVETNEYIDSLSSRVFLKACINNNELGTFFLLNPEAMWNYGVDVSVEGLEKLSREIVELDVRSVKDRERAFISLAVHYNSDLWLRYLIRDYRSGLIQEVIPQPYRKYFYQEFGRRLRTQYNNRKDRLTEIIKDWPVEQQSEIISGFEMATSYLGSIPFVRHNKRELIDIHERWRR